ncbi:urease accessory protein UreE [Leptolyngbya sp. FACHB-36]|uniref:urease accessory protein UreE n=1 Tax=Leptolyngbya sp. FACHB-36 TaxID=2692808 RepID=UPI001681847B|nr:urease accessory protein UreE [Leptolyngbya sp. FACHB-36]MBD2018989.1 urease accessory protein UreE [Leptolyngbya sp. FACHB-36]
MTAIAQTYLGNCITDSTLAARVEQARRSGQCLEVSLHPADRPKGRIHAHAASGEAIGIVKPRDQAICEGDTFATDTGKLLIVHLEAQTVMVLSVAGDVTGHEIALIHLGHALGNHHWSILVQQNEIYVQLTSDPHVIESTIRSFNIPGIQIRYESRSPEQPLTFSHHSHH